MYRESMVKDFVSWKQETETESFKMAAQEEPSAAAIRVAVGEREKMMGLCVSFLDGEYGRVRRARQDKEGMECITEMETLMP